MRTFDLSPLFRSSVGFDRLDKVFDAAFREATRDVSYPPYNIVRTSADAYRIEMAVAGFGEGDLDVTSQENLLTIRGEAKAPQDKEFEYLYRGIAQRAFEHKFRIADHVRVEAATLENGLLVIELAREIPEAMRPRKIAINHGEGPRVIESAPSEAAAA